MNIRNVVLGIASLVFATGSAFASLSLASPEFINVLYAGEPDWVCTKIPTCPIGTTFDCKVTVPVVPMPSVQFVYNNDTPATTCSVRLKTSRAAAPGITKPKTIVGARSIAQ